MRVYAKGYFLAEKDESPLKKAINFKSYVSIDQEPYKFSRSLVDGLKNLRNALGQRGIQVIMGEDRSFENIMPFKLIIGLVVVIKSQLTWTAGFNVSYY